MTSRSIDGVHHDAHTFRVTWNVSTSANGVSFAPVGAIVITFVV